MEKSQNNGNKRHLKDVGAVYVVADESVGFQHEYDIKHNSETQETSIHRSMSGNWSEDCKGELIASLNDDGDHVLISISSHLIYLDYSEIEALTALLLSCNSVDMEIREQKIISKITNKNK